MEIVDSSLIFSVCNTMFIQKVEYLSHLLDLHLVAMSAIIVSCLCNCFTFVTSRSHLKNEGLRCVSVLCEGRSSRSFSSIRYLILLISNSLLKCWLILTPHTVSDSVSKIDLSYSLPGFLGSLASYKHKVFSLERLSSKILSLPLMCSKSM